MAVKTISVATAAHERLKAARRYPGESFSEIILRAQWPEDTITGEGLLRRYRNEGAHLREGRWHSFCPSVATRNE